MRRFGSGRRLLAILVLFSGFLFGCAGREYAPKRQILYYHKELPAAERSVEAARQAGKDKACPAEFAAAEKMKNDAYETYWSCRTREGIAQANEAARMANALCPAKVEAPKPAPTASLAADPAVIEQGKCSTLSWSTTNASAASIDQGVGTVPTSGSKSVCPSATTPYTLTASGAGGSGTAAATVTVNPPPPPEKITLMVEFDTAKWDVKPVYGDEIARVADFMKRHPNVNAVIEGHTDNIGKENANKKLSLQRAESVKKYLVDKFGVDPSRLSTKGYGPSRPVASNTTAEGRQKNRRIEASFSE